MYITFFLRTKLSLLFLFSYIQIPPEPQQSVGLNLISLSETPLEPNATMLTACDRHHAY